MYTTICKIDSQWEFAVTQGSKTGALWQPRGVGWGGKWKGGSRGRGHMYTYGWFMLMYGRNKRNIVKKLAFKKKPKKHDWWKPTSFSRACAPSLMELVPAFSSPPMCSSSTLPSKKVTLLLIWQKFTCSSWDLLLSECLGMISILIN